jgi:hypothetical protein
VIGELMIFQLIVALGLAQGAVLSAPPQERAVLMDRDGTRFASSYGQEVIRS